MSSSLAEQTAERRFQTSLIGLFSLAALLLSAIGIYGLMHYFVVQRANEIGVRMALGARYGNVLSAGFAARLATGRPRNRVGNRGCICTHASAFEPAVWSDQPTDPVTFAAAPAILLGVAALACWIPARRAARIDPVRALRQE